jgi:hypothetical protein
MRVQLTLGRRRPQPPSREQVAEAVGAISPGVRQRRLPEPRPNDFNARLRRSLRGGTGAPFWRT